MEYAGPRYGGCFLKFVLSAIGLAIILAGFLVLLAGCLIVWWYLAYPKSEFSVAFTGIRDERSSDSAYIVFCDPSDPDSYSTIVYFTHEHSVSLYLPDKTSAGTHDLATEADALTNYIIGLRLEAIGRYERGSITYDESDLLRGTITIKQFRRTYDSSLEGSFEAEFTDGLQVTGNFKISMRYDGNSEPDFNCFGGRSRRR
ncbi:MAG: hypothetical protein L0154_25875 [Chloroflexi bacterium]|nr:hypothetical protein [Chloroflexota bacterium]